MTAPVRETFTFQPLGWTPWLERATDTNLTPAQRQRVVEFIGDVPHSAYLDVLSNDLEAVQARAFVHRHVYTADDPEHVANRELGATTTSRINGCVYCASVHARRYANSPGRRATIQQFLADGLDAELEAIDRAIVDVSAQLTLDPETLTSESLQPLRDLGFDDLEILDVLNYAAFFANANRLMLSLGEPTAPAR